MEIRKVFATQRSKTSLSSAKPKSRPGIPTWRSVTSYSWDRNAGQDIFEDEKRKHTDQLNHNTVVMMEMQDTINGLRREISGVGHQAATPAQVQTPAPEGPVMFTRLDSERNAKIMKRAVNERRLTPHKYEYALGTMEQYVSLPAKRLAHLVNKYVHHTQMKHIEENVRKSKNLDEDVFQVLDKMETLQNDRAKKWAEKMDMMGEDRMRLVGDLMATLDDIEKESGVFLIKPMYSYKGNGAPEKYQGKLSRAYRPPLQDARMNSRLGTAYAPVSTPASNVRGYKSTQDGTLPDPVYGYYTPESRPEDGVSGLSSNLIGDYPRPVWQQSASTNPLETAKYGPILPGQINTPRILELDINRMLIGQNQVSLRVPEGFVSNDRLANAANSSIRSYVTVNRPTGHQAPNKSDRPRSHTGISDAPPATPMMRDQTSERSERAQTPLGSHSAGSKRVKLQTDTSNSSSSSPVPHTFPTSSPLPPIAGDSPVEAKEVPFPPASPPGSSLRQTPAYPSRMDTQTPA